MRLSSKILKAINEGIKQSFIIGDDELEIESNSIFQHENIVKQIQNVQLYYVKDMQIGDVLYNDPVYGINKKQGEPVGKLVIKEAGKPLVFLYSTIFNGYDWDEATELCTHMTLGLWGKPKYKNAYLKFYLPTVLELNKARQNYDVYKEKTCFWCNELDQQSYRGAFNGVSQNHGLFSRSAKISVQPFFMVKNLREINESNNFIIDDDELETENNSIFQHEETNYDSLQNKMNDNYYHNFLACKFGDRIYLDDQLGYNTKKGDYVGFCCIEAGVMPDNKPRFAYKEDLPEKMNQNAAIQKCKEIPNGYLPDKDELKLAFDNGLALSPPDYYWSSTQIDSDYAYFLNVNNGNINHNYKGINYYVRPFFHIPQLKAAK